MGRLLVVCVGGFLGTGARYGLNGWVAHRFGESFPWGTLTVNVSGSFVVGLLYFLCGPDSPVVVSATTRQFLIAGLLGGFTTFSSFSLQTLNLLRDGEVGSACVNVVASVVLGMLAVFAGDAVARGVWMPR